MHNSSKLQAHPSIPAYSHAEVADRCARERRRKRKERWRQTDKSNVIVWVVFVCATSRRSKWAEFLEWHVYTLVCVTEWSERFAQLRLQPRYICIVKVVVNRRVYCISSGIAHGSAMRGRLVIIAGGLYLSREDDLPWKSAQSVRPMNRMDYSWIWYSARLKDRFVRRPFVSHQPLRRTFASHVPSSWIDF